MCVVYFTSYQHCDHNSLLGIFNCGLNCPTGTRHTFIIEDPSGPCQTCTFLSNEELDPDVAPVEFYAPTHEASTKQFHHAHQENIGREASNQKTRRYSGEEGHMAPDYEPTTGSLSDPDSLTSEWRLGPSSLNAYQSHMHNPEYLYQYTYQHHDNHTHTQVLAPDPAQVSQQQAQVEELAPDMTPRTAAHRHLVQDQLKKLPTILKAQQQQQQQPMGKFFVPGGYTAGGGGDGMGNGAAIGRGGLKGQSD